MQGDPGGGMILNKGPFSNSAYSVGGGMSFVWKIKAFRCLMDGPRFSKSFLSSLHVHQPCVSNRPLQQPAEITRNGTDLGLTTPSSWLGRRWRKNPAACSQTRSALQQETINFYLSINSQCRVPTQIARF